MNRRVPTRETPSARSSGARAFDRRQRARAQKEQRQLRRGRAVDRRAGGSLVRALRAVPLAAWVCGAVACINAVAWSLIVPPFQVPDETDHFAYVQQLAENGRLPVAGAHRVLSYEENLAMQDLHQGAIRYTPEVGSIGSRAEQQKLLHDLRYAYPIHEPLSAGVASSEPPLYYAIEAIPYGLASGGTLLDRLELMRLFSALTAAFTAIFAFLFVRETLPSAPWTWTVAGLGVALTPMLAEISGAVNPDAMLIAVSSALFYCLARAFRRGLTPRMAVVIGALTAVGFLTKLNFIGLAPGVLLGLFVLAARAAHRGRAAALRSLALALAIAVSPVVLYVFANLLSSHTGLGAGSDAVAFVNRSVPQELSYMWQLYLPRLPGMRSYFPGVLTTRQLWFNGLTGLFGWVDTTFPGWVYDAALIVAAVIVALSIRATLAARDHLQGRLGELLVYGAMAVGLLALVGGDSYVSDVVSGIGPYWQPRYLLPMVPLLGALLALAARGAGPRWGPTAGALIVVLVLSQDIFGQLQTIARFYG